jgi:hypothetical protein
MCRAFFLAIGIFCVILGFECLGVERALLRIRDEPPVTLWLPDAGKPGPNKQIAPAPWAPWSLMSAGAVVCLYSFTIPKRVGGG